jgi:hypothetical protein
MFDFSSLKAFIVQERGEEISSKPLNLGSFRPSNAALVVNVRAYCSGFTVWRNLFDLMFSYWSKRFPKIC